MPRSRLRALLAIPLAAGAVLIGGIGVAGALTDPLARHGAEAEGTILATGHGPNDQRWARVRFATPAGSVVALIAVCHHQSYEVGGTVPVVYDTGQPTVAGERNMHPTLRRALTAPGVLLLMGLAGAFTLVRTRRRRPKAAETAPPAGTPEAAVAGEPAPRVETPAEWLEDVLVGADA